MTATREELLDWIDEAKSMRASYLIVALDTYDYDNYPIYVMPGEDFYSKLPDGSNMQTYDEVYDMSMDLDRQLKEFRAKHLPKRVGG